MCIAMYIIAVIRFVYSTVCMASIVKQTVCLKIKNQPNPKFSLYV